MAKPGPKVGGPEKGGPTSIRFERALKAKLEAEARANNRTFSDEVEIRLTQSFDLGRSSQTRAFCECLALMLSELARYTGQSWMNDPFTFDQAKRGVIALMKVFQPPGPIEIPPDLPEVVFAKKFGLKEPPNVAQRHFGVAAAACTVDLLHRHYGKHAELALKYLPEMTANMDIFIRLKKFASTLWPKMHRVELPEEFIELEMRPGAMAFGVGYPFIGEQMTKQIAKGRKK